MPICGPKLSTVGLVLSIWGIVQLVLTGVFFHARSVALVEDLGVEDENETFENSQQLINSLEVKYDQVWGTKGPFLVCHHCDIDDLQALLSKMAGKVNKKACADLEATLECSLAADSCEI